MNMTIDKFRLPTMPLIHFRTNLIYILMGHKGTDNNRQKNKIWFSLVSLNKSNC